MLRVGTRGSALALAQTDIAIETMRRATPQELGVEIVVIKTSGEASPDRPFEAIGPKGVFAVELQHALLDDRIDVAVHSLKDLPAYEPDGLVLAAILERADPRDVLVSRDGKTLAGLPPGAVVGTSSARRAALVRIVRPDLDIAALRGNVDTRLRKVRDGEVDAAVLAAAGIVRLGRADEITEWLDPVVFVPPPGQGAIVVEARGDRVSADLAWLSGADHDATRACVEAERAFMRVVEGSCEVPLGGWARYEGGVIVCDGFIASADVERHARDRVSGTDSLAIGRELADKLTRSVGLT